MQENHFAIGNQPLFKLSLVIVRIRDAQPCSGGLRMLGMRLGKLEKHVASLGKPVLLK